MVDDQPVIRITVNAEANIGDIVGPGLDILDDGLIASLERRQATVIRNEILAALKRAKDERTDVFGFGTAFARRFPRQWEKMADSWDEQFLPDLPVELIVEPRSAGWDCVFRRLGCSEAGNEAASGEKRMK